VEKLADVWGYPSKILEASLRVLSRYQLCDRCLGRLFARLGRGLDNAERGRAIKVFLRMLSTNSEFSKKTLDSLQEGWLAPSEGRLEVCYVCGSKLDEIILELSDKAVKSLKESGIKVSSFLVGVKAGSDIEKRQNEVIGVLGLDTWESVRREVKRLVGKAITRELSLTPDFTNPDVIVVLDLTERKVELRIPPLILGGRYVKLGRFISQMPWIRSNGSRKYRLSIYEVCEDVLRAFNGAGLVLHAAGREDVDARALGDGRPLALEIKEATTKDFPQGEVKALELKREPWIHIVLNSKASREYVRLIKTAPARKTYRAVIFSSSKLSKDDLQKIESLSHQIISQRTPTRVLKRKKDIVRRRRVYEINATLISEHVIEVLLRVDGGLYVKEFVDGDDGRTTPSFSEVTGKPMRVVLLDVLEVEKIQSLKK